MSTFLKICQNVSRECGVSGGQTVPTAVIGQSGELNLIVNHVIQSWTEIQDRHPNWRWMRAGFTVDTTTSDDSYAFGDCTDDITSSAITRFAHWRFNDYNDPPKSYLVSDGVNTQRWLLWESWDWFKRIYRIGTQNDGIPAHISIDPQNNLVLGPKPNGIFQISGDYQRGAQILAADDDTPDMPASFHDLIMYWAVRKYGTFKSSQELLNQAAIGIGTKLPQLEGDQLPEILLGAPMA